MQDLKGEILGEGSMDIELVEHLEWCDGPLLSLYQDAAHNFYLMYWCDWDAVSNSSRWVLLRVALKDVILLLTENKTYQEVLPYGALDDHVVIIDNSESGTVRRKVLLADIPARYKPHESAMVEGT